MEPRNYLANASATPPAAPGTPSNGYPQSAVPGVNEATVPGPFWFYKTGEEIRAVLTAAGLTPSDGDLTQLSASIAALIAAATPDASESVKGIIERATAAEAQALTDNVRALTPARLASALQGSNQVLGGGSGYQKLPGGLIVQWGGPVTTSGSTGVAVTFPIAFPNSHLSAACTASQNSSVECTFSGLNATGFTLHGWLPSTGARSSFNGVYWMAIGY